MSDSDSDDTFVVVGTPLKPYEEDEPVKKQYDIQNQKVKDARGRQRFHGAFTGGFSAGYFNTVGSKEGWAPSGFVSSRGSRIENAQRRPEDFMDEEDLGEYGIAPRVIKATEEFRSDQPKAVKRPFVTGGLIPGEAPLATLIKPASSSTTMGIRLLRKLGWRDGQGVGPRIRKKKKKRKQTEGNKVYGCSLPGIEKNQGSSSEDEALDLIPTDLTFAPKDIAPIDFKPKDNLYGLGYSGLRVGPETSHFQPFDELPEVAGSNGKKGIRGQAFGVGALEEDDDDIYTSDKFSNYDRVLGGPDNTGTYGWTAPTNKGGNDNKDYADTVLEGFKLMSTRLQPRKVYPPPQLPRDFKPYHVFTEQENATTRMAQEIPKKFSMTWKKMDVTDRREALGEKPDIKSVFDLINEKDKQHMSSCQTTVTPSVLSSSQTNEQIEKAKAALMMGITSRFQSVGTEVISPTGEQTSSLSSSSSQPDISEPKVNTPLYKGSAGFKPFASDPEKQARYEKYLASKVKGNMDDREHDAGHMTEWEKSREKDEFARASQLYRPMSLLMASRFTRAEFKDEDKVLVNKEQGGDGSDQTEAARMKMYGQLTHDTLEWHPDKLLCKRFNVPNPYPESSVVGLPKVKREKFSIFNFLTIPGEESQRTDPEMSLVNEETIEPHEGKGVRKKKLGQQGKPLAILASVDLRQSSHKSESNQSSQDQEEKAMGEEETELKTDQLGGDDSSVLPSRPPPDIFKAVFGDSDPEDSSSEDENDEESVEEETIGLSRVDAKPLMDEMRHNVMDSSNSSVCKQTSQMEVYDSFGVKIDLPKSGLLYGTSCKEPSLQTIDSKESVDVVVPNTDLCDAYGPPLPPGLGQNNDNCVPAQSNLPPTTQPGLHRKKKKHKEEKHKHKKKGKHKKHKEKHKKKKKTREVIVIGTPSGSEEDTEDSYSSNPDAEKCITERTSKFQVLHQR